MSILSEPAGGVPQPPNPSVQLHGGGRTLGGSEQLGLLYFVSWNCTLTVPSEINSAAQTNIDTDNMTSDKL